MKLDLSILERKYHVVKQFENDLDVKVEFFYDEGEWAKGYRTFDFHLIVEDKENGGLAEVEGWDEGPYTCRYVPHSGWEMSDIDVDSEKFDIVDADVFVDTDEVRKLLMECVDEALLEVEG